MKPESRLTKRRFQTNRWVSVGILSLLGVTRPVVADSWGPPAKEHWSRNHEYVLRLEQEDRGAELSLCHETGAVKERLWARGYEGGQRIPAVAYVADTGEYVVQRDGYAFLGHGVVIVIRGPQGKVKASYELKDFLSQEEISRAHGSFSSIWWAKYSWLDFINRSTQFALVTERGTIRCFDLATGRLMMTDSIRDSVRRLAVADATLWTSSAEAGDRIRGIRSSPWLPNRHWPATRLACKARRSRIGRGTRLPRSCPSRPDR